MPYVYAVSAQAVQRSREGFPIRTAHHIMIVNEDSYSDVVAEANKRCHALWPPKEGWGQPSMLLREVEAIHELRTFPRHQRPWNADYIKRYIEGQVNERPLMQHQLAATNKQAGFLASELYRLLGVKSDLLRYNVLEYFCGVRSCKSLSRAQAAVLIDWTQHPAAHVEIWDAIARYNYERLFVDDILINEESTDVITTD